MGLFLGGYCRYVRVNCEFPREWTPLQPDIVYLGGRNRFRLLSSAWNKLCCLLICRGSDDLEVQNRLAQGVKRVIDAAV